MTVLSFDTVLYDVRMTDLIFYRVTIPSYNVSPGEVITMGKKASEIPSVMESLKESKESSIPTWLERKAGAGLVKAKPEREHITFPVEEQLIVEYYSR